MEGECVADLPDRISPLEELAMPFVGDGDVGVVLSERLCGSLMQVQAWPTTISKTRDSLSAAVENRDAIVMETGPGRWLLDDDGEALEKILRAVINSDLGSVTSLTHGRVVIGVSGSKAEWVLASGIALDFSTTAFPVGSTQMSHHHEIGLTIHRTGENSFDLYVFTSFARAFWGWITKASAEVGYSVA